MTITETAKAMRIANAQAKRSIQTKRSKDAKTIAKVRYNMNHSKFPTYYKYG